MMSSKKDTRKAPTQVRKVFVVAAASLLVLASGCGSDTTGAERAVAAADTAADAAGAVADSVADAAAAVAGAAAETTQPNGTKGGAFIDTSKWADSLIREFCRSLRPTDIDLLAQRLGVTADELKERCGIAPSTLPGGKNFTCGVFGCGNPQVADAIVSDLCKAIIDRGSPATMQILAERLGTSAEALARACLK